MTITLTRPEQRLKAARKAAGYITATAFADAFDIAQPTYLSHERGKDHGGRGISHEAAQNYATCLRAALPTITDEWIRFGEGPTPFITEDAPPNDDDGAATPIEACPLDVDTMFDAIATVITIAKEEGIPISPDDMAAAALETYSQLKGQPPTPVTAPGHGHGDLVGSTVNLIRFTKARAKRGR